MCADRGGGKRCVVHRWVIEARSPGADATSCGGAPAPRPPAHRDPDRAGAASSNNSSNSSLGSPAAPSGAGRATLRCAEHALRLGPPGGGSGWAAGFRGPGPRHGNGPVRRRGRRARSRVGGRRGSPVHLRAARSAGTRRAAGHRRNNAGTPGGWTRRVPRRIWPRLPALGLARRDPLPRPAASGDRPRATAALGRSGAWGRPIPGGGQDINRPESRSHTRARRGGGTRRCA